MNSEITTVKGFQDFMPEESARRKVVRDIVEKWFWLYGFSLIETPIVEFDELMKGREKDEAVSDRFRLRDKGGRELGLRYEFTFQLARILKQNPNLKMPFKRYQIGEVFRDEPVSSSRFRQFTQCDADTIGDSSVEAEAEILAMFSDILKELKIKNEIQINNRKLLESIIASVEIEDSEAVMMELDKVEKLGIDMVKSNLREYASPNQIITLFKLLEKDLKFYKENAFEGVNELEELIEVMKMYGLKVRFNQFMVRGLGYYTGNIFEIKAIGENNSIAAGGRYDKTVGKFLPREIPAVGCSFGLERITQLAQVKVPDFAKVLVISLSQEKPSIELAQKLRKKNISCVLSFQKLSKALDYANVYNIPYVVFLGEEETSKKKYKLKDMKTGKESFVSEKQLIGKLGK